MVRNTWTSWCRVRWQLERDRCYWQHVKVTTLNGKFDQLSSLNGVREWAFILVPPGPGRILGSWNFSRYFSGSWNFLGHFYGSWNFFGLIGGSWNFFWHFYGSSNFLGGNFICIMSCYRKLGKNLQDRFWHLYPNLLVYGLNSEKKPILMSTFRLIWAKFQDFIISRFWVMAASWKKGDSFFLVFHIFEAFLAIFGNEMYETLNRTGWF